MVPNWCDCGWSVSHALLMMFEGSGKDSGRGLIERPEIHIKGLRRAGRCSMMSGVVVIDGNAGSLTGAAMRGGDPPAKGRVGARTGIDQKGGMITCSAAPPRRRRRRSAAAILRGDVGLGLGLDDHGRCTSVAWSSRWIDCVEGEWTDADELIQRVRIHRLGTPPKPKSACARRPAQLRLQPAERKDGARRPRPRV